MQGALFSCAQITRKAGVHKQIDSVLQNEHVFQPPLQEIKAMKTMTQQFNDTDSLLDELREILKVIDDMMHDDHSSGGEIVGNIQRFVEESSWYSQVRRDGDVFAHPVNAMSYVWDAHDIRADIENIIDTAKMRMEECDPPSPEEMHAWLIWRLRESWWVRATVVGNIGHHDQEEEKKLAMATAYTYDDSDDYELDDKVADSEDSVYSPERRYLPTFDAMLRCYEWIMENASTYTDAAQIPVKTMLFEMLVDYAEEELENHSLRDNCASDFLALMSECKFPRSIVRAALLQRQGKQSIESELADTAAAIVAIKTD